MAQEQINPMREIRIEKVTVNVGLAKSLEKLDQVKAFLERIVDKQAVVTHAHKRSTFGAGKGRAQGVKTTLRGEKAKEFLTRCFKATENKLSASKFDNQGNVSFGIKEYLDMPGLEYDPDIGVMGFEIMVTLTRPGFGIRKRRIRPAKVGKKHRISKEEAIEFMKNNFDIEIV